MTLRVLISVLAGIAGAVVMFAAATDLGVLYLLFGLSTGFSVHQLLKRR